MALSAAGGIRPVLAHGSWNVRATLRFSPPGRLRRPGGEKRHARLSFRQPGMNAGPNTAYGGKRP